MCDRMETFAVVIEKDSPRRRRRNAQRFPNATSESQQPDLTSNTEFNRSYEDILEPRQSCVVVPDLNNFFAGSNSTDRGSGSMDSSGVRNRTFAENRRDRLCEALGDIVSSIGMVVLRSGRHFSCERILPLLELYCESTDPPRSKLTSPELCSFAKLATAYTGIAETFRMYPTTSENLSKRLKNGSLDPLRESIRKAFKHRCWSTGGSINDTYNRRLRATRKMIDRGVPELVKGYIDKRASLEDSKETDGPSSCIVFLVEDFALGLRSERLDPFEVSYLLHFEFERYQLSRKCRYQRRMPVILSCKGLKWPESIIVTQVFKEISSFLDCVSGTFTGEIILVHYNTLGSYMWKALDSLTQINSKSRIVVVAHDSDLLPLRIEHSRADLFEPGDRADILGGNTLNFLSLQRGQSISEKMKGWRSKDWVKLMRIIDRDIVRCDIGHKKVDWASAKEIARFGVDRKGLEDYYKRNVIEWPNLVHSIRDGLRFNLDWELTQKSEV